MKQEEAIRLLDETFNHEFDIGKFINFLNELLKNFKVEMKTLGINKEYNQWINKAKILGKYNDGKKDMEIYVVELKKDSSLERARTMQRNFIAKWLSQQTIDAALVAFYYKDSPEDWRFSFVKMEYKLVGEGKVSKELTPAKRYSFLVGKNEPNYTCRKQFLHLLKEEEIPPTMEELEKTFSVEKVTKEFFEEYKKRFFELKASLEDLTNRDKTVKEEFENKGISTTEFSKKLLGQIVFLYFLQKKGWLGVKRDSSGKFGKWGEGSKRFLQDLFKDAEKKKKNFFNDYLEPLFYSALAIDRRADEDYFEKFDCKVPFLNGGLFEPINKYNWGETDVLLDNEIFEKIIKTFDEFNFTIKEDEPLEKEVAVDPEMLGKVFENLLDVSDRKSKGAFYTPREIVHYMCQQSLINYLETNTQDLKIPKDHIEIFVLKGDIALDQLRRKDVGRYTNKELLLPETISKNYQKLDSLLKEIKICDPAVGSGAFPVGMMNEIIKARNILTYFFLRKEQEKRTDYNLKRETIENSLYGVDIEPSAVEITKLRFWLSLIVDELDMKNIQPLPNLENKIMCGNSLIEEFEGIKLFDERLLNGNGKTKEKQTKLDERWEKKKKDAKRRLGDLKSLQQAYFNEQNRKLKNEYMDLINKIEWEFIEESLKEEENEDAIKKLNQYKNSRSKPFFLWRLYFSDIFNRHNPGFDVVIANPPYDVIYSNKNPEFYHIYKEIYSSAEYNPNLFAMFIEKSISLLKQKGILNFIIPDTLLTNTYFKNIRREILYAGNILEILDLRSGTFEQAIVDNIIFEFAKGKKEKEAISIGYGIGNTKNLETGNFRRKEILQTRFLDSNNNEFNIYLDSNLEKIKIKMMKNSTLLGNISNIKRGMVTKNNELFVISNIKETKFSKDKLKPLLVGKDATRYRLSYSGKFIYFDDSAKGGGCWDKNIYESKEKIIIALITGGMKYRINATYDNHQFYVLQNYNNLIVTDEKFETKYILALINSRLINYYYEMFFNDKNIKRIQLQQIPIAIISKVKQEPFIESVDKILEIINDKNYMTNSEKQAKVKAYEKKIDKMVYELYGLTKEEIEIVEGIGKKDSNIKESAYIEAQ